MADQDPLSHKAQTSAQVKIELRFQSEFCSVSGSPLCFLQVRLKSTESSRISLNRTRPVIEFLDAKDDNIPVAYHFFLSLMLPTAPMNQSSRII